MNRFGSSFEQHVASISETKHFTRSHAQCATLRWTRVPPLDCLPRARANASFEVLYRRRQCKTVLFASFNGLIIRNLSPTVSFFAMDLSASDFPSDAVVNVAGESDSELIA